MTYAAYKAQRNRDAAVDAFLGRKAEIDTMLARLQSLSDDHFDVLPDETNWGDVGDLDYYASLLRWVTDAAFGEGEHAELSA